jgi:dTDP-glucose pyrophosphorylase
MNAIILSAGSAGSSGDAYPVSLSEFNGKPLIQILLEKWQGMNVNFGVMLSADDIARYHLDRVVTQVSPSAKVYSVSAPTAGAACTALMAVEQINADEPLLILNGDELLDIDYEAPLKFFNDSGFDAGVISFDSVHPRYSYVRLDENDLVIEAAEKNPISRNATVGFYWYRHGSSFVEAAMRSIRKQALLDKPFFVCPVFNELILKHQKIGVYKIDQSLYKPFKSQQQIAQFQAVLEKML